MLNTLHMQLIRHEHTTSADGFGVIYCQVWVPDESDVLDAISKYFNSYHDIAWILCFCEAWTPNNNKVYFAAAVPNVLIFQAENRVSTVLFLQLPECRKADVFRNYSDNFG